MRTATRIFLALGIALAVAPIVCSCQIDRLEPRPDWKRPPPLPADLAAPFAYDAKAPVAPTLERIDDTPEWEKLCGTYKAPCPITGESREVVFEFWRSKLGGSGRLPLVVIVPILAGRYPECDHLGQLMARNAMHAFFVHREESLIPLSKDEVAANIVKPVSFDVKLRRSIVNMRRTLDWAVTRPDVAADEVGLVGISLGAIAGTYVLALEPRIRRGVLIMGGGDMPGLMSDSIETPVRRYKVHAMRDNGWTEDQFKAAVRKEFPVDPLDLAPYIGAERVQQYISKYDNKVPTAYQWKLWEALGRPEGYAIPIGHYTAILYIGFAEAHAVAFMKRGLLHPQTEPPPAPAPGASKVAAASSSY